MCSVLVSMLRLESNTGGIRYSQQQDEDAAELPSSSSRLPRSPQRFTQLLINSDSALVANKSAADNAPRSSTTNGDKTVGYTGDDNRPQDDLLETAAGDRDESQ